MSLDPLTMFQPRRKVTGISAVLLPFTGSGDVDWPAFEAHVARTAGAGLTPAVNMDTGYVNLIDHATQGEMLRRTKEVLEGGTFVAGMFVAEIEGGGGLVREASRAVGGHPTSAFEASERPFPVFPVSFLRV